MKLIVETQNVYVCETCGKKNPDSNVIEKCEMIHNCEHEWIYDSFYMSLRRSCVKCETVESMNLYNEVLGDIDMDDSGVSDEAGLLNYLLGSGVIVEVIFKVISKEFYNKERNN